MKKSLVIILFTIFSYSLSSQIVQTPITPTAQGFLKYGETPVSKYTGIPNISIPIYEIKLDNLIVPIQLTYHAGGIRVSDEASWVGLGWDLNFGSIVQVINDLDDFIDNSTGQYSKMQPDFHESPIPSEFPLRYQYPSNTEGIGWSATFPIHEPKDSYSFKIVTDYYVPVNGDFTSRRVDLFESEYIDSEPDVFKVNFLGHSLHFVLDFKTGKIVLLNERGYKINRINTEHSNWGWEIIDPSGNIYEFSEKSVALSYSVGAQDFTGVMYSGAQNIPSSKQWFLTKITTSKKQTISFTYKQSNEIVSLPYYAENYQKSTLTNEYYAWESWDSYKAYTSGIYKSSLLKYVSYTKRRIPYLSSISFPNGKISFQTSLREDIFNDVQLDELLIFHKDQVRKKIKFNYEYFEAIKNTGLNMYSFFNNYSLNEKNKRLKLVSLKEEGKNPYEFMYNKVQLPAKHSFAVDYWGYYNGQHSNNSLIPNPIRLNNPDIGAINNNNHSSNADYAKAGLLEQIYYPTGGRSEFIFELNEFDNYWVPDFNNLTNQISSGNGIRVKTVVAYDEDDKVTGKTNYKYFGGKSIIPKGFFNTYNITHFLNTTYRPKISRYRIDEIFGSGFYSSNMFGSVNGVGYDQVEIEKVTQANEAKIGRITYYYHNNPDVGFYISQKMPNLPTKTDRFKFANGTVKKIEYRDIDSILVRKEVFDYINIKSDLKYGAKIHSHTSYIQRVAGVKAQHMIGYYPLFSDKTIIKLKHVYEYELGGVIETIFDYEYNKYNVITKEISHDKNGQELLKYSYSYPSNGILVDKNILNTYTAKYTSRQGVLKFRDVYTFGEDYGNALLKKHDIYVGGQIVKTKIIDKHDCCGNVLEYHTNTGERKCYVWGYNNQYLVAEIENTSYSEIETILGLNFELGGSGLSQIQEANLRNNLPDAFVTSYSYKPIVGITSKTDPNGLTISCEYDEFGRLSLVRDFNTDIFQQNVYNYRTSTLKLSQIFCDKAVFVVGDKIVCNIDACQGSGDYTYFWSLKDGNTILTTETNSNQFIATLPGGGNLTVSCTVIDKKTGKSSNRSKNLAVSGESLSVKFRDILSNTTSSGMKYTYGNLQCISGLTVTFTLLSLSSSGTTFTIDGLSHFVQYGSKDISISTGSSSLIPCRIEIKNGTIGASAQITIKSILGGVKIGSPNVMSTSIP